jgi:hypothetical protein
MGDTCMHHEVMQAIWSFGRLTLREKARLAVAYREARPWYVADATADRAAAHSAAVLRFKSDPFSRSIYFTHHPLTVSIWRKTHTPTSMGERPLLHRGCAVNIYIDEADAETLGQICGWLGREVAPRHVFFWTQDRPGPRRLLTDDMLLACAWNAETVGVTFNELITDASVSRLLKCRDIRIENTGITVRSLRDLPDLMHVHCIPASTDAETLAWLNTMHDNKMLILNTW